MDLLASTTGLRAIEGPERGLPASETATDGLLAHLIRRGPFRRYDFFLLHNSAEAADRRIIPSCFRGLEERIGLFKRAQIPGEIERRPWDLLYSDLISGAYIRDTFARSGFPIVHNLGDAQSWIQGDEFLLLLSNLRPYDTILYRSESQRAEIQEACRAGAERIRGSFGIRLELPARFEKLPHGVDPEVFQPRPRTAARGSTRLPEDRRLLLCVGDPSIGSATSFSPVLRAFRDALSRAPADGRPCLILRRPRQEGRDSEPVEQAIRDLGLQGDVRIREGGSLPALLNASDVLVFGSCSAAGGTPEEIVLQAMASGVPVVVPDYDEFQGLVAQGKTGLRIPLHGAGVADVPVFPVTCDGRATSRGSPSGWDRADEGALGRAIRDLVASDDLRARMAQESRRRVQREFTWERVVNRFVSLCDQRIRECRKAPAFGPRADRPGLAVANCGFFGTFRQNYTEILEGRRVVRTSSLGEDALAGRQPLSIYGRLRPYVDGGLLETTLNECRGGKPLRDLGGQKEALARERTTFHVLWLLKHGLLKVDAGKGEERTE